MKSLAIRLFMVFVILTMVASVPALACDTGKISGIMLLPSGNSKAACVFAASNTGIDPPKGTFDYIDCNTGMIIKSTSINFVGLDFAIHEGYFKGLATVTVKGVKKTNVPFEVDVYDNKGLGKPDTITIYLTPPAPPANPLYSSKLVLLGDIHLSK